MTDLQTPPADRDLLRAFADRADQAAFAELVRRHGGLVLGVCRRVLDDAPDADDAFQAVFLVLARKAGSVRSPERLGNWLYGVAVRCAKRAKARAARRRARELPMTERPGPGGDPADWRDVRPVLDEEIARLPEKLRAVVVLCELEGVSRADAAAKLGVPEGTVSSRLARGKDALRRRLVKRGVALSAVGVGVLLTRAAPAAVSPGLAAQTVSAAIGFAAGGAATAGAAAAGLATTEIKLMFWMKALKVGLAAAVVAAAGGGAAVGYARLAAAAEDKKSDKDKLQGEWKVLSVKVGGNDAELRDEVVGQKMTFREDKMTLTRKSNGYFEATYTLDPSKDPKQADFTVLVGPEADKGKVAAAIYKLDGAKLTLHLSHPGQDRPTDFESAAGQTSILLVLERVKK